MWYEKKIYFVSTVTSYLDLLSMNLQWWIDEADPEGYRNVVNINNFPSITSYTLFISLYFHYCELSHHLCKGFEYQKAGV